MYSNVLKMNLKNLLKSREFYICLLISFVCFTFPCVSNYIYMFSLDQMELCPAYIYFPMYAVDSFGNTFSQYFIIFSFIIPFLCCLSFSSCFYNESKINLAPIIITKAGKKHYFLSQSLAVFIGGLCIVLIPLLINFFATLIIAPISTNMPPTGGFPDYVDENSKRSFTSYLVYTHPYLYNILISITASIVGGCFAVFSYAFSFLIKKKFVFITFPFILYLILDYLIPSDNDILQIPSRWFIPDVYTCNLAWQMIIPVILALLSLLIVIKVNTSPKRDAF